MKEECFIINNGIINRGGNIKWNQFSEWRVLGRPIPPTDRKKLPQPVKLNAKNKTIMYHTNRTPTYVLILYLLITEMDPVSWINVRLTILLLSFPRHKHKLLERLYQMKLSLIINVNRQHAQKRMTSHYIYTPATTNPNRLSLLLHNFGRILITWDHIELRFSPSTFHFAPPAASVGMESKEKIN